VVGEDRKRSAPRRRPLALVASLLALTCALAALLAPMAEAAVEATKTYAPGAFYGGQGSEPGQFSEPSQIAAEPATGNLLVTDTGNGRVQVLATDAGGNPSYLENLGVGTLVTPVGVAVDPGTGAVYVSDSGAGKIFRFTSDGAPTPTYTLDPTFTSPTDVGSFASTLAIDPTTHDLLLADTGSQVVRRFDVADGHLINAFNGADSPGGQFTSLRSLAVAPSGRIYVVDEPYAEAIYNEPSAGRVERFDAAGNSLGRLQEAPAAGAVGVDPLSGTAFVAWQNSFFLSPRRLAVYEGTDLPSSVIDLPAEISGGAVGVALAGAGPRCVCVLTEAEFGAFGAPGIQPLRPAEIPAAALGSTSAIGVSSAHVSGAVAPGSLSGAATAHFEYSLDGANWTPTPDQAGITGPGESAISADLTGLRPNSTYSLRIHVANEDFAAESPIASFTTSPVAPGVEIAPPTDRTATSAVLNGSVNPFGQQTTYHFAYGQSTAYGSTAPAGIEDVAGKGYAPRIASHAITGLQPGATYHYRLVATNATGTSATADATFTTATAGAPVRAYEQVTPVQKRGLVVSVSGFYRAEPAGNGIVYQGKHAYDAPDTAGSTNTPHYAAVRSPSGWELRQLDVPQAVAKDPAAPIFGSTLAVSADLSHALVGSDLKLAPGGVEGSGNLYRRDVASGNLELVATGLSLQETHTQTALFTFFGGSQDFSRILLNSNQKLTPDAHQGLLSLYEWSVADGLQLVSTFPGGGAADGESRGADGTEWPSKQSASDDATRFYFAQGAGSADGLYLHEAGESRLVSPPGGSVRLLDVTADGRFAAYAEAGTIYRYDRLSDSREVVGTVDVNEHGFLGMSENGSTIFLGTLSGSLTVWHEGVTTTIGTQEGPENFTVRGLAVSPDGRYLIFDSAELASPYDNTNLQACGGRCREVYVYDVQEERLTCASCPANGAPPAGQAEMGATSPEFSRYGPPFVNDNGQGFFDTPTALVGADTNGRRDVYEYRDGEVRLISPGGGDFDARFADVSANGDDVFFLTEQGLVGQDQDRQPDIYDARLGGGIASQSPAPAPSCAGEDCRGPVAGPIALPAPASETLAARPLAHRRKHRRHKAKPRHHRKRRHAAAANLNPTAGK
jgi:hypothetical protein